ncbi:MAG: hypothetical protein IPJ39_18545 [Saprospiraceae bacterium]|nr:hypothetical protein [Saprospiraceae bacterium]
MVFKIPVNWNQKNFCSIDGYNYLGTPVNIGTISASNGSYGFDNLEAKFYSVKFSSTGTYRFTAPSSTTDDLDSDANPNTGATRV